MNKKEKQYFADGCVLCPSAQVARVYQADYLKGSYYWANVLTACVCAAVEHCIELKPELAIRYVSPQDATPRKSGHQRVYNPNDMKFSIWENKNKSKENESNARNKTIRKKEGKES